MEPFHVEQTTNPRPRLKQLRARLQSDVSTADRAIFLAHEPRCYIAVEQEGRVYTLSFFQECPCGD